MADLDADDGAMRVEREGLPKGYRMRADAHYVDQLSARSPDVPMRLVPVHEIDAPGGSPLDPAALCALTQSIAEHGVIQPLIVRRDGARYRLIAGRKRLAAARAASVARVPCLVHSIDEKQAEALARALAVTADTAAAEFRASNLDRTANVDRSANLTADVIAQVSDAIATIQSATSLVSDAGSAAVRRVAMDLVRASTWRASWQLRAAAIVAGIHRWQERSHQVGAVVARVRDGFAAETRLQGIDLYVGASDWNLSATLDEDAVVAGVSGAIAALAGLAGAGDSPRLRLTLQRLDGSLAIEIAQDAVVPDAAVRDRFFDSAWVDRPGGRSARIGAASARAVAERHGGTAAFIVDANRGCAVRLTFANARH